MNVPACSFLQLIRKLAGQSKAVRVTAATDNPVFQRSLSRKYPSLRVVPRTLASEWLPATLDQYHLSANMPNACA